MIQQGVRANKERACRQLGMDSILLRLPETTSQEELIRRVDKLNADKSVNGILVQLPLPGTIDEGEVLRRISPEKDVDGFHAVNAGRQMQGERGTVACTPAGCPDLIRTTGVRVGGAEAVVVGRSNIVGKPMAMLLLQKQRNRDDLPLAQQRTSPRQRADILVWWQWAGRA